MTKATTKIELEISDHPDAPYPQPALSEMLSFLGEELSKYQWVVGDVEAVGDRAGTLMYKLWHAKNRIIVVEGDELVCLTTGILQIIWGAFLALPRDVTPPTRVWAELGRSEGVQHPDAVFEFRVCDGGWYDCCFQDPKWAEAFREKFKP